PERMSNVYLVATTHRSRSRPRYRPTISSDWPSWYLFAVSMKLPPPAAYASMIRWLSFSSAPKPQTSPKLIVPRHNSDTRSPLGPSSLYRIAFASLPVVCAVRRRVAAARSRRMGELTHSVADVLTDRVRDGLGTIAEAQLGQHAAHVMFDRLARDEQPRGDLAVGASGAHERQHL